ncbi:hypothetical protein FRC01_008118, partial [Tulasnella sp. 417]
PRQLRTSQTLTRSRSAGHSPYRYLRRSASNQPSKTPKKLPPVGRTKSENTSLTKITSTATGARRGSYKKLPIFQFSASAKN